MRTSGPSRLLFLALIPLSGALSASCGVAEISGEINGSGAADPSLETQEDPVRGGRRRRPDAAAETPDSGVITSPPDSGVVPPPIDAGVVDTGVVEPPPPPPDAGTTARPDNARVVTSVTVLSEAKVEVHYAGVSDLEGGWRARFFWFSTDWSGCGVSCGAQRSQDTVVWEGFKPGTSYTTYIQYENGEYSPRVSFTTPPLSGETVPPVLTGLTLNPFFGGGMIVVYGSDNTGMSKVEFYAGDAATPFATSSNSSYRAVNPDGSIMYYVAPPADVHGATSIRARAYDVQGNTADVSATLTLP